MVDNVLDAGIVLRSDGGVARPGDTRTISGAGAVAEQALTFGRLSSFARPALLNGAAGGHGRRPATAVAPHGLHRLRRKILAIDVLADPGRLHRLDLAAPQPNDGPFDSRDAIQPGIWGEEPDRPLDAADDERRVYLAPAKSGIIQ